MSVCVFVIFTQKMRQILSDDCTFFTPFELAEAVMRQSRLFNVLRRKKFWFQKLIFLWLSHNTHTHTHTHTHTVSLSLSRSLSHTHSLSISFSVCYCLSLSFSFSAGLFLFLYLSQSASFPLCFTFATLFPLSLSVCLYRLYLSLCLCGFLSSHCLSFSVRVCASFLTVSLSLFLCVSFLSLSVCMCVFLSSHYFSFCLCVCFFPLSLSLSHVHSHTHPPLSLIKLLSLSPYLFFTPLHTYTLSLSHTMSISIPLTWLHNSLSPSLRFTVFLFSNSLSQSAKSQGLAGIHKISYDSLTIVVLEWVQHHKIHNTSLTNWTNKLECLSLARLSSLVLCNSLAYWANS